MSTAGIPPAEIFRQPWAAVNNIRRKALEARFIALEIDLFGRDLIDASRGLIDYTGLHGAPLQGSMGGISAGSNLTEYFRNKAEQYALENRQTQKMFLKHWG